MGSLDLTRLTNNALVHLPGAIPGNLKLELFNVFADFFDSTNIWQEEITFGVTSSTKRYSIEQSSVSTIARLISLKNSSGIAVGATMMEPGEIVLNNTPTTAETFTASVALNVDDPVSAEGYPEFPAWVLGKYFSGILDGLLGRMFAQPAKPWTNEKMAVFRMRKFQGAMSQAKLEVLHANLNNGQTWRFPQSFASRRA